MRNLSLIVLLSFAGIHGAIAQSMLKVRLTDNSQITVAVDGRYFNKVGTTVTVGELPPGRHRFTIYAVQQDRRGRGHEEVVYSGKVFTHNGFITLFTYDPYSRDTHLQDQDITSYSQTTPPVNNGVGTYENNIPPQVNNNNSDYGNDNKYVDPNTPLASPVAPESIGTLTDAKTANLKKKVADKKADTEKMNILKDGLKNERYTTDQVAQIMDWFSFESTKVDFAKWAYPNTVDKENFSTLESKLTYKNYEDDLDQFIKNNGK